MAVAVRYTALRSLSGALFGTLVDLDLKVRYAGISRSSQIFETTRRSLSGVRESYFQAEEESYSISTIPLNAQQQAQIRMFLDSVNHGESFLFSPDGSSTYATAYLEPRTYSETREPARDSFKAYSFSVVVP